MLVWVTGLSGTGKSSVAERLRERGHRSVDADDDGISGWRSHATGEIVPSPPIEERPPDWLERFDWSIDLRHVEALRHSADGRPIFLFGAVENESEVLALADVVVCLVADAATLRRRLAMRETNDFGKAPGDVDAVMSWLDVFEQRHEAIGAAMIDATQSLPQVVDAVLAAASSVVEQRVVDGSGCGAECFDRAGHPSGGKPGPNSRSGWSPRRSHGAMALGGHRRRRGPSSS